jgi:hypothetical protein
MLAINRKTPMRRASNRSKVRHGKLAHRAGFPTPNFSPAGLASGGETARSEGFGMKLVLWLVEQIGGELQINPRHDGHRSRVTVTFCPQQKSV